MDSINLEKVMEKEDHLYSPETIVKLQRATQTNNYDLFKEYSSELNSNNQKTSFKKSIAL